MAGGSMKDIKRRIKSVESTGQITKAMELVASSKLRRAKERASQSRPYFETIYQTICDISNANTEFSSVFVREREVKAVLLVVIAGDRGLAGGYNTNIFKLVKADIDALQKQGKEVKVVAIGKKAVEHYEKRDVTLVSKYPGIAEDLDQIRVDRISKTVTSLFISDEIDEAYVYYTQFISALSQEPTKMKLLPVVNITNDAPQADATGEGENTAGEKAENYIEYEPSPEGVFDAIVPQYISGILYGAVLESFASEQGARRTAMESASDNASAMIDALSLKYNRARQAAITQEISEIVSGGNASN